MTPEEIKTMDELGLHEANLLKEVIQMVRENDEFEKEHIIDVYGKDVTTFEECAQEMLENTSLSKSISEANDNMTKRYSLDVTGLDADIYLSLIHI